MRQAIIDAGLLTADEAPKPKNPRKYDVLYRLNEATEPKYEHNHGCSSIDRDDWRARANARPMRVTKKRVR